MIRKNPSGDLPVIAELDKTAIICGKVVIGENVFVGPYAVIRADEVNEHGDMDPIIIGANSNIQDGVVIHSKSGAAVTIGEFSSIAHRSIVHGPCTVGNRVFIGFNSVLFNCAVGDGSVVRHNSVVVHHPYRSQHRPVAIPTGQRQRLGVFRGRGAHQRRPGARLQSPAKRVLSMSSLLIRNACVVNEGRQFDADIRG